MLREISATKFKVCWTICYPDYDALNKNTVHYIVTLIDLLTEWS